MAEPAALAVEGLSLDIGGARILTGVDLTVGSGELLAVIGPNGAGKTTLLNVLTGLLAPTRGRVLLGGRDVTTDPPWQRVRAGLGRTFQTSSVFANLSVRDNVRVALEAAVSPRVRWRPHRRESGWGERARRILDTVGLAEHATRPAGGLSHGDKRKLEIALVLAGEPRVLLLDEPLAGLGMADVPHLVELVRRLHRADTTVIMVEHHMEVVLDLAERVAVLHHGALLTCAPPAQVMADATVSAAYLGEPL